MRTVCEENLGGHLYFEPYTEVYLIRSYPTDTRARYCFWCGRKLDDPERDKRWNMEGDDNGK